MTYGFRFILIDQCGEPHDPPAFVSAAPNWMAGEVITLGAGEKLCVVEVREPTPEIVDEGFSGTLVVEPV